MSFRNLENIDWVIKYRKISQCAPIKLTRATSARYNQTHSSFTRRNISEPPWLTRVVTGDPFVVPAVASFSFCVLLKAPPPDAKYSRSQPDRSLKQFRPGVCPDAVDRRLGEISSGRRTGSRSPRRPSRPPCWPIHVCRAPRTLADTRVDPPSRFSSDSPDILSAYQAAPGLANAVGCILP